MIYVGRIVSVAAAFALALLPAFAFAVARPDHYPAINADGPDPSILRFGATFYLYTTETRHDPFGVGLPCKNVPVYESSDLVTWTSRPDALPHSAMGSWVNKNPNSNECSLTWAPTVHKFGADFVLYYSAPDRSSGRQCIGRAIAPNPTGPFRDTFSGPLVCNTAHTHIDARVFVDDDGAYLLWGGHDALHSWKLTADGRNVTSERSRLLDRTAAWETPLVENPAMVKVAGTYHLFYSANEWNTASYATGWATCPGPRGPCTKRSTSEPWLRSFDNLVGPGGMDVFRDGKNQIRAVLHAWEPGAVGWGSGRRRPFLGRIDFSDQTPRLTVANGFEVSGAGHGAVGFWTVSPTGIVTAHDGVENFGSHLLQDSEPRVVGMASKSSGGGYWLVTSRGRVHAFGAAQHHGDTSAMQLNRPIVGMASRPSGNGYWLVGADGGVFAFGDAHYHGGTGATQLNQPIVGMASSPSGNGYWLVAADGGIFDYGDALFRGSMGDTTLNQPVVGMAAAPTGAGYWLVGRDGGVFAFPASLFKDAVNGEPGSTAEPVAIASAGGTRYRVIRSHGCNYLSNGDPADPPPSCDDGKPCTTDTFTPGIGCQYAFAPLCLQPILSLLMDDACGDGEVAAGEQCDDANAVSGDGCSASCTIELTPVAGHHLVMKDAGPSARSISFEVRDPEIQLDTELDPRSAGLSIELFNPATGEGSSFFIPPAKAAWKVRGAGSRAAYAYRDAKSVHGPCTRVSVKQGLIEADCSSKVKPISFSLDEPTQGNMVVHVAGGKRTYCALFGGRVSADRGEMVPASKGTGIFQASKSKATANCPPKPY